MSLRCVATDVRRRIPAAKRFEVSECGLRLEKLLPADEGECARPDN
jgi:hypothetical protein